MSNYDKALVLASNQNSLLARLRDARSCLAVDLRREFGRGRMDYARFRLVGRNGLYLQWSVREHPYQPISYENQQTNRGIVQLFGVN